MGAEDPEPTREPVHFRVGAEEWEVRVRGATKASRTSGALTLMELEFRRAAEVRVVLTPYRDLDAMDAGELQPLFESSVFEPEQAD